jgi:hypothetical protein
MSTPKSKIVIDPEHVLTMTDTINPLFNETGRLFNQYQNEPSAGSIAVREIASFPSSELVRDVHYRGVLSMEAAADHLVSFADLLMQPAKTVAPWTCVRGLLESSAIGIWFLSPDIDVRERVARCFAFRYIGFVQQMKFFQASNEPSRIDEVRSRMSKVENDALLLGYSKLADQKGRINGIARQMPTITDLIAATLDRESEYRLLSGVAHGHHWATQQTSFRVVEAPNAQGISEKALEKHVHPDFVVFAGCIAVTSFAKVNWFLWRLYGWNVSELEALLDTTFDQLRYSRRIRFWR